LIHFYKRLSDFHIFKGGNFPLLTMADNLTDAHTFTLDWQGNIYTIATITQHMSHTTKLIVATLNRKVFCLELSMSHCARPCGCVVVPQTQELQFTYIPSGAEIISIDAFNKSKVGDDFVIGVTIIKSAESGSPGQYLNIYSDWDSVADIDSKEFELENLAQSCFSLPLDYIPYQLTHCEVGEMTLWLLGGSDKKVHIYSEDKAKHMYQEIDAGNLLPEFASSFSSVPLWIDICMHGKYRVTATGCECGLLVVTSYELGSPNSLQTWYKEYDGPLTCTKLFSVTPPPIASPLYLSVPTPHTPSIVPPLHLCVSHSLGHTEVFHDLLAVGLTTPTQLLNSNSADIVTTVCVADLTLTGQFRLVLGTYGQELLVYRMGDAEEWELEWSKSLPAPVLGVRWVDMTGDGLRELVVITTKGVQVLQNQLDIVKEVTLERLRKLVHQKGERKTS